MFVSLYYPFLDTIISFFLPFWSKFNLYSLNSRILCVPELCSVLNLLRNALLNVLLILLISKASSVCVQRQLPIHLSTPRREFYPFSNSCLATFSAISFNSRDDRRLTFVRRWSERISERGTF